jgi:hypothetical protein
MGKSVTWFDGSDEDAQEWKDLCPENEFRVVKASQLPKIVPSRLLDKADSALVIASGTASGDVVYMLNINRVDQTDRAIDQEAFGIAFRSDDTTTSGCLIHHGQWENRTSKPPQCFWDVVAASGIGNCYPIPELPVAKSGTLSELCIKSQEGAFQEVVTKLKAMFDE